MQNGEKRWSNSDSRNEVSSESLTRDLVSPFFAIWASTQSISRTRDAATQSLRLPRATFIPAQKPAEEKKEMRLCPRKLT
eukprot:3134838-Pyramimonas_sp.AAC.1